MISAVGNKEQCKCLMDMPDEEVLSRGLPYSIVSIVNRTVLCSSTFVKREDLVLCVFTTKKQKQTQINKTKRTEGNVDCGDGVTGVWIRPNSSNCTC